MKCDYLIIGAGFAGSVFAERIANVLNKKVILVEKRNHIGGNSYDEKNKNGILIHKYGPHIFHTNSEKVFDYLSQFTEWRRYEHKVLAKLDGKFYPIPINRTTINKLYSKNFTTDKEVNSFYERVRICKQEINNSEDIIVNKVGIDLYEKFFKYYTKKQWKLDPSELSSQVCGRIPVRTNPDDRYFTDNYQFMPKEGYTEIFKKMLNHKNIEIILNTDYKQIINDVKFGKMVYTGPIDYFFDHKYGKLPYRSLDFIWENHQHESFQDAAVVNYVEEKPEFTRITEYKKITGQKSKTTTISKEYPKFNGEPYYPIINESNNNIHKKYFFEAKKLKNVLFLGRLAEYKYYNMDQVVARCLTLFEREL
ncbi:MAG: UDP-galactopyranose mutase [Ignavibacteriae bacterium]|nr:MAG: UDP-galactopyranose mutase [Ignavibacteriota bacterium]